MYSGLKCNNVLTVNNVMDNIMFGVLLKFSEYEDFTTATKQTVPRVIFIRMYRKYGV